ncbi:MAG: dodecin domain-containing protein [Spirochaetales bacterium]|nr:dodecin domain-containing protein [Spirochaetales bacterium]
MPTIVKVIEVVSESAKSWEDAAQNAVIDASKTVKNITGVDVIGFKGEVKNNRIVKFKAHCKIAFIVEP